MLKTWGNRLVSGTRFAKARSFAVQTGLLLSLTSKGASGMDASRASIIHSRLLKTLQIVVALACSVRSELMQIPATSKRRVNVLIRIFIGYLRLHMRPSG